MKDIKYFTAYSDENNVLTTDYVSEDDSRHTEQFEHEALKPCPHCGGEGFIRPYTIYGTAHVRIWCSKCGASSYVSAVAPPVYKPKKPHSFPISLKEVCTNWNMRVYE